MTTHASVITVMCLECRVVSDDFDDIPKLKKFVIDHIESCNRPEFEEILFGLIRDHEESVMLDELLQNGTYINAKLVVCPKCHVPMDPVRESAEDEHVESVLDCHITECGVAYIKMFETR